MKLLSLGSYPPFNNMLYNAGTLNGRCTSPLLLDTWQIWRGPKASLEGWGGGRAGSFQFFLCSHSPVSLCPILDNSTSCQHQHPRGLDMQDPFSDILDFLNSNLFLLALQSSGQGSCFLLPLSLLFQHSLLAILVLQYSLLWDEWCLPHIHMLKS